MVYNLRVWFRLTGLASSEKKQYMRKGCKKYIGTNIEDKKKRAKSMRGTILNWWKQAASPILVWWVAREIWIAQVSESHCRTP